MLVAGAVAVSGCVFYESPYDEEPECSDVCESPRLEFSARSVTEPGYEGRDFPGEGEVVAELSWGRRDSKRVCLRGPCIERRPKEDYWHCMRGPCSGDPDDYGGGLLLGVDEGETVEVSVFYESELVFEDAFVVDYTPQTVEVTWDPGDPDDPLYEKDCHDCLVHEHESVVTMPSVVAAEGYPGQCDASDYDEPLVGVAERTFGLGRTVEWFAQDTGLATFTVEPSDGRATTKVDVVEPSTCRIRGADEGEVAQLTVPVTQGQILMVRVRSRSVLRVEMSS